MERRFGVVPVVLSCVSAFAAGAVGSWYAFGAPRGVDLVANNGSTADWVAAVGTAVVGVGAMLLAYEAHRLRLREVAKEDEKELNLEAGRLLAVSYRLEIARHPGKVFGELDVSSGRVDCAFVQAILRTTLNAFNGLEWKDDEIAMLPRQCIPKMVGLQITIKAYRDLGEILLQKCQSNRTLSADGAEYSAVANAAVTLRLECDEVVGGILARIDEIRDRLLQLQVAR